MVVQVNSAPLAEIISRLNPEQQDVIKDSPRQTRLALMSQFLDQTEIQVLQEIGKQCNLEVIEQFELHPDATDLIPLRLIHEFQCLPISGTNDLLPTFAIVQTAAEVCNVRRIGCKGCMGMDTERYLF